MILSKTPMRITLGGGGTDLKSYYSKKGGHVISMAINKYIYIFLKESPNNEFYNLHYSKHEIKRDIKDIEHPIIRECLKYFKNKYGLNTKFEISSLSDVVSGNGLGSSSSYTIGLLNCLFSYINKKISKKQLAELACFIEISKLKNPIGKQDQYIASYGGIISLKISRDGSTDVESLNKMNKNIKKLIKNTYIYDTKLRRSASTILISQNIKTKKNDKTVISSLNVIKEFGKKSYEVFFKQKDIHYWASTLDEHWQNKKRLSNKISLNFIDKLYSDLLKKKLIIGGKIIGAGGGGFFLIYSNKKENLFEKLLKNHNFTKFNYSISLEGSKIIEIL